MRNSVIYFSETGNTEAIARFVADDARSVEGMEARLFRPAEGPDKSFVNESAAVRFGAPTHCASLCWQMKKIVDTEWTCGWGAGWGRRSPPKIPPTAAGRRQPSRVWSPIFWSGACRPIPAAQSAAALSSTPDPRW